MTLFSYVVDHDYGFASNPYANTCVLSLCKYKKGIHGHRSIQDEAIKGDWVVGTGGKSNESSGHDTLLYAMCITDVKPYREYLTSDIFSAKKDAGYGFEDLVADDDGSLAHVPVLISDDFYYFGSQKQMLPAFLTSIQKRGQNFQKFGNDDSKASNFINWLRSSFLTKGMIGTPCNPWLSLGIFLFSIIIFYPSVSKALVFGQAKDYRNSDLAVYVVSDIEQADFVAYYINLEDNNLTKSDIDSILRLCKNTDFIWFQYTDEGDAQGNMNIPEQLKYQHLLWTSDQNSLSIFFIHRDIEYADFKIFFITNPKDIKKCGWRNKRHYFKSFDNHTIEEYRQKEYLKDHKYGEDTGDE